MSRGPNIVLITLDCVRPDFLGCYGCGAVRTPHLDRMAARGVVFDQAFSQAPNTWVSHAGILTGCYPPLHGLRSPYDGILEEVPTLAEVLGGRGYATAGFPGNDLVGSRMGFGRGFDLFFEAYLEEPASPSGGNGGGGGAGPSGRPGGVPVTANNRNPWEEVLAAAHRWLPGRKGPVFLWFHYLDTHHLPDLDLPEYFRFSQDPHWQFYEGKISYADERCVGAVLELLRRHGRYEDAVIAVLSDHGEGLWPGRPPAHNGELTDDAIRVPLILFGERLPSRGVRVGSLVRTVDLAPTLAALAGVRVEAFPGRLSGVPLPVPGPGAGALAGGGGDAGPGGTPAYAENEPLGLACVRTDAWKVLLRGGRTSLFHLPSDPAEQVNLADRHPETAARLGRELERIRSPGPARRRAALREEEETRRLLRSLGYVE